ncbi:hypothetical protein FQN60_006999 [Etheostoma spectabile]|uniref:Uncharacterized protein n=1 Tax=Etheostoma spectabile TaxID=54343 RepID=A0A5J5C9X6_9PERO|nr:hypothetical protein FQN60_006999 [Etheostoma spectabile]
MDPEKPSDGRVEDLAHEEDLLRVAFSDHDHERTVELQHRDFGRDFNRPSDEDGGGGCSFGTGLVHVQRRFVQNLQRRVSETTDEWKWNTASPPSSEMPLRFALPPNMSVIPISDSTSFSFLQPFGDVVGADGVLQRCHDVRQHQQHGVGAVEGQLKDRGVQLVVVIVDVADETHDCVWIQAFHQLVDLPVGLPLHVLIDGICTFGGFGEVHVEPFCEVRLLQGLQELRLWLEAVVHEHGGPFVGVPLGCVVGPLEERLEGMVHISLGQEGAVEAQTTKKLAVRLPLRAHGQHGQGGGHGTRGEEDVLSLRVSVSC